MSTVTITGSDIRLRKAIVRQLDWDTRVDASAIGVAVKDGIVTLTGFVDSYAGKLAAERIVKQVRGVRAVANDITVRLRVARTDADIAREVAQALELVPSLADRVQATVHNGHVTLTGTVEWLHQTEQAEQAVHHVRGVLGVFNHVTVAPKSGQRDIQRRIVRALHHNADIDARRIRVSLEGDVVTLSGALDSLMQREMAEAAAGSAPGITRVNNQIVVEPPDWPDLDEADEIC
jgi:osmotically-inducible protein OsmY